MSFISLPGTRMKQSFCQWKQMCVTRTQRRMSPTCPTTIWSPLKLTSWNEDLSRTFPSTENLTQKHATMQRCVWLLRFNAAASSSHRMHRNAGAPLCFHPVAVTLPACLIQSLTVIFFVLTPSDLSVKGLQEAWHHSGGHKSCATFSNMLLGHLKRFGSCGSGYDCERWKWSLETNSLLNLPALFYLSLSCFVFLAYHLLDLRGVCMVCDEIMQLRSLSSSCLNLSLKCYPQWHHPSVWLLWEYRHEALCDFMVQLPPAFCEFIFVCVQV